MKYEIYIHIESIVESIAINLGIICKWVDIKTMDMDAIT